VSLPLITDDDIRRVMSHRAFEAGIEYQMDGRAHDLRTIADGTTIQARVVDIAADFPLRLVEPSGDISFELTERSGIDWFDLDLGVMLDGQRISLVPALLDFIANTGMDAVASLGVETDDHALPMLPPLPDGRLLTIPLAQLRPILAPLLELFTGAEIDGEAGTLRLSRRNAGDLALLEAASAEGGIVWAGGDAIRALGRQLREHGGIPPYPVPGGFGAVLRSYQAHGLSPPASRSW
jgi:hypothetical protein